jgi:hypothetical protein
MMLCLPAPSIEAISSKEVKKLLRPGSVLGELPPARWYVCRAGDVIKTTLSFTAAHHFVVVRPKGIVLGLVGFA